MSTSVIVVTHNSQKFLGKMFEALDKQTKQPHEILLIDSGSENIEYLTHYSVNPLVKLHIAKKDVGFCIANNIGYRLMSDASKYVLFLNPDAFLERYFIEKAEEKMAEKRFSDCALLTGTLLGYNLDQEIPTGLYDSRGICSTFYGRWYDRDRGKIVSEQPTIEEEIEAACGALLFCRKNALKKVELSEGAVFNERFFMYKEDIDLSLRLRSCGYKVLFFPTLYAYHCRGWHQKRKKMAKKFRLCSARNEWRINRRLNFLKAIYSLSKYFAVKVFNI